MTRATTLNITTNWFWKQRDPAVASVFGELASPNSSDSDIISSWTPTHAFPSEIHLELLHVSRIPNPFIGFNEHKIQWVGEKEWLYKCEFKTPSLANGEHAVLEFKGLDTVCNVYLNDIKVLYAENQFRTYIVPLDQSTLRVSSPNSILLHFFSAGRLALEREAQYGKVRAGSTNLGHPSRVYVRKAQYDWRWDWGPEIMTVGPYRTIKLITYSARLLSLHAHAIVSPNSGQQVEAATASRSLTVDVVLGGTLSTVHTLHIVLRDTAGHEIKHEEVPATGCEGDETELKSVVRWQLGSAVKLWWPVGYGAQTLYDIEITLLGESATHLDTLTHRIGFRSVALIQDPLLDTSGTSFLFEVNGVRMFLGGSNWVPADNFLTRVTPEKHRAWLELLRDGGQNMVRVWGGGVYEPDEFYDICDELGLLVWQDFQFACGVYPAYDSFVASVAAEARDNITRLRRHPALVLFCGNNEDYQQVLQWGDVTDLPARKLYEVVLPTLVAQLTGPYAPVPYHRGSPYGGKGWDTSDPTVGDVHIWDVWAAERPWQEYVTRGGRFVSEFGIPAMPDIRTMRYWMADTAPDGSKGVDLAQWHAQSKVMAQHTKAGGFERRFAVLMNENFRLTTELETYMYNTQILQSEAVSYAYRVWRRQWKGRGREYTAGVLVWQSNDCWPVTSWAIADYFLRPKPVYYTIKRELQSFTVGIFRTVTKNKPNDRPAQFYEFGAFQSRAATIDIWGTNSTLTPRAITLELVCVDLVSPWTHRETYSFELHPNQATELLSINCPNPPLPATEIGKEWPAATTTHSVVVSARLLDAQTGTVLARMADWPQPFRHVDFPDPRLKVTVKGEEIRVEAERPAKGVVLSVAEGEEAKWSDNTLDVMPDDAQVILARGLGVRKVKIAYMGKEKATLA